MWVRRAWPLGVALALLAGAALRLAYGRDIEYKYDEQWIFQKAQRVGRVEPWPWLGMDSSAQAPNPGLSVWVFVALSRLAGAAEPPDLARAIQFLNVAALVGLVGFVARLVPSAEREPWWWAVALAAVNPFAVLFQRKIWLPSVFPVFTLAMLAGWWRRDRPAGAFVWGLVGALLGQVQMSGFFFAAGFAAWAALFDAQRTRWRAWAAGSCLGALTLLPWVWDFLSRSGADTVGARKWYHVAEGKFWELWGSDALGLSARYSLGNNFTEFLAWPPVAGRPSYLVAAAYSVLVVAGAAVLTRAAILLIRHRSAWRIQWTGVGSPTAFTQNAALWGYGVLLTLAGFAIHRHYLIVAFPLTLVWLARVALCVPGQAGAVARPGRGLLLAVWLAQFLVSACFLQYVHEQGQAIRGDYGAPYSVWVKGPGRGVTDRPDEASSPPPPPDARRPGPRPPQVPR
jgi:hypothetical protein